MKITRLYMLYVTVGKINNKIKNYLYIYLFYPTGKYWKTDETNDKA